MTRTELIKQLSYVNVQDPVARDVLIEAANMLEADGDTSVFDDVVKQSIETGLELARLQAAARLALDALVKADKISGYANDKTVIATLTEALQENKV